VGIYRRKDSGKFWCEFIFQGRRIQESTGTSDRELAEQYEAQRKRDLWTQAKLGVKPSRCWEEAVVSYLASLPDGRNKKQTAKEVARFEHRLLGVKLDAIDIDLLESLQAERTALAQKTLGRKPRPGTINRCMGIIMAVLHHAASKKWLAHVPQFAKLPDTEKVIRFISREEAEKLLGELPEHQARMVIFALETGLRKSNVTQLRWKQVDLPRRIAWVNPDEAKESKGIAVPLSAAAVALLEQVKGQHSEYVFVYRGEPVKQTSTKAWKEAKARAGITNFRWHDLRHTWASWHRQDGTPPAVLKELGGWKDDRMPGRYAHLGDEHLAAYVERREGLPTKVTTVARKSKKRSDVTV
jgi:integrase